ncbi:hypothetical protein BY996DRAFT_6413065 [Phakopsora pachyrhizi]|nr:hypothetical protein BY996DRAFT_6413065 [Phakopsora pachyrhizi]
MSAHSAATTNIKVYLPNNCSAALKVLKCSESAVGFQAMSHSKSVSRFTGTGLSVMPLMPKVSGQFEWYILSYQILKNEINHTVDDPQNIANSVCSVSQRATKSVRIAKPTYYANLVATRANKENKARGSGLRDNNFEEYWSLIQSGKIQAPIGDRDPRFRFTI